MWPRPFMMCRPASIRGRRRGGTRLLPAARVGAEAACSPTVAERPPCRLIFSSSERLALQLEAPTGPEAPRGTFAHRDLDPRMREMRDRRNCPAAGRVLR
jgi:hypothetical protein